MLGEEVGCLSWDPLREQDWNSLGNLGDDNVMEGALWESVGDGMLGSAVAGHQSCDSLEIDEAGMHVKDTTQFSPMTIDAQFDCFWDNFPGQGLDASSQDESRNVLGNVKHEAGARSHAQAAGQRSMMTMAHTETPASAKTYWL